ncbi:flagellar motor switch protein FliM [Epulopiscium sp. SCG-B10WGA-EpuloA2]|nr:flagellar motor switch protein FliM [Epulopiscium sp. SCG-B10WGA-EpuloA2]
MSELLSQEEIDALFAALDTGELDVEVISKADKERVIKEYNFARPTKFSREHLRTLELMGENYARLISQYLSGMLRTLVPIKVVSSEAITFSDFTSALSNPIALAIIDPLPLKNNMLLELSTNIAFAFLERLLGGEGTALEHVREFTTIELVIIIRILENFVDYLREPWENMIDLKPRMSRVETNSQILNMIAPTEMVALITFSIQFGAVDGIMNLCIPYLTVEPIMDKLNTSYQFQTSDDKKAERDTNIEYMLKRANIPMKAVVGQTRITVREFLELQVNDVIRLDKSIESLIDVYVGNVVKFKAVPGIYKNKSAIQIKEILEMEDD